MKSIKLVTRYIKMVWKKCIPCLIIAVFIIGLQIVMPLAVRQFLYGIEENSTVKLLVISLILYALLLVVYNLVDVLWMKSLDRMGGAILSKIREELMRSIYYAPYKKVLNIGTEKIKNIIYMDTINIFGCISVHTVNIIINFIIVCIFDVIAFNINMMFGVGLLLVAVVGFALAMLTRRRIAAASRSVNIKMKADNKNVGEYVDSLEMARSNNLIDYFVTKENDAIDDFISTSLKADNTLVSLRNLVSQFHQWASMLLIALTTMYVKGDAGDIVFAMLVLDIVLDASKNLENSVYQIVRNEPSFEHVGDIIELLPKKERKYASKTSKQPVEGSNTSEACSMQEYENIRDVENVSFNDVTFSYDDRKEVIKKLNAEFEKGEIIHVKGENGAGKSTFIKLLNGLLEPDSGKICFNNISCSEISPEVKCENVLYVGQDENLLNETEMKYLDIITSSSCSTKQIKDVLSGLGVTEADMERTIEELGMSLSGGQRRKLLLAKLMLMYDKAPVIIIDEIENDLDKNTRQLWREFTQKLYEEKDRHIIFYISHDYDGEGFCTRTFTLK